MIHVSTEAGRHIARIEGELTIYDAAANKPALLAALAGNAELEINLSGVTEIDSAGLQLLLLTKREALRSGKDLRLVAHSEATLTVIDLLGLAGYFGDPLVLLA